MNIGDRVREIYERRPYPSGNHRALKAPSWSFSLEWVQTMAAGERSEAPARVLIAGCGDGTEAFSLRRRLPAAEIVAVDFSPRSIAIATRLQRRAKENRGIRFILGDLTDPLLPAIVGGKFDLILCHGVLSYVSNPERALKNLGLCLKPEGSLYIGVNGSAHISRRLRKALPALGFNLAIFADSARIRKVLKLCDAVLSQAGLPHIAGLNAAFLAGDVFGALNRSLPLQRWISLGRRAGLHFRGNLRSMGWFRQMAQDELYRLLIPRSRAQAANLLESLSPAQFHRLLFSRIPEANPPWENRRLLLKWRMVPTSLYKLSSIRRRGPVRDRRGFVLISSPILGIYGRWQMPDWELELLRRADGHGSLASVLSDIPLSVPFAELQKELYFLYQLAVINLLPPASVK